MKEKKRSRVRVSEEGRQGRGGGREIFDITINRVILAMYYIMWILA